MASALLTRSAGLDAACCKGEILILVVAELLSSARSIGFVEPVGTSPFLWSCRSRFLRYAAAGVGASTQHVAANRSLVCR